MADLVKHDRQHIGHPGRESGRARKYIARSHDPAPQVGRAQGVGRVLRTVARGPVHEPEARPVVVEREVRRELPVGGATLGLK